METPNSTAPHQELAAEIADRLAAAADRLHDARELEDFVAALDEHRLAWRKISQAGSDFGGLISDQMVEFSLSTAGRASGRLDDQAIESLIRINRFASQALAKACADAEGASS